MSVAVTVTEIVPASLVVGLAVKEPSPLGISQEGKTPPSAKVTVYSKVAVSPVSISLKLSLAMVYVLSRSLIIVWSTSRFATVGASLMLATVMVISSVTLAPPLSVAIILTTFAPTAVLVGVPLMVPLAKVNPSGRPVALMVKLESTSSRSAKVFAGTA